MDFIGGIISSISGYMYSYILIALLIAAGLYFSFRTRFVQIRLLGESIRVIAEPKKDKDSISSFQALMVSTASRVGTGNIVGVTGAIIAGGPGAVFWMWLIALLGGASAFVESTLAQIYKKKGAEGSYGGPAYYIKQALRAPALGGVFAVFLILTYMGGFNALASFNLTDFVKAYIPSENASLIIGAVVAVLSGIVIFGGGKRISKATQIMVPIMAIAYIGVALIVMILNITSLPSVIGAIFKGAFNFSSVAGGLFGATIMNGIKRGLYSNEAGIGSAPNAAASANVSHPVKQGLVQMLSVYIDTIVICSATGFMLLCSGVVPEEGIAGMPYVQEAVAGSLGGFGSVFITVALFLFAFTTLIGNFYYAEMGLRYICDKTPKKMIMNIFRIAAALIVCMGATMDFSVVWDTADVLMGLMALINLPVIVLLAKPALRCMQDYFKQKKSGKNPVFKAKDINLETKTDFWN